MTQAKPNLDLGNLSVENLTTKYCLDKNHLQKLRTIFAEADTNGDGQLDQTEFSGWMKALDDRKMGIDELKIYVKALFDDYDSRRRQILLRKLLELRNKGEDVSERRRAVANLGSNLGFAAFLYIISNFCTSSESELIDFEYLTFAGGPNMVLTIGSFDNVCDRMSKMKHFASVKEKFHLEFGVDPETPIKKQQFQDMAESTPFLLWPVKNLQVIMRERSLGFEEWSMRKKAALKREKRLNKIKYRVDNSRVGGLAKKNQGYGNAELRENRVIKLKKVIPVESKNLGTYLGKAYKRNKREFDNAQQYKHHREWNEGLIVSLRSSSWEPDEEAVKRGRSFMGHEDKELAKVSKTVRSMRKLRRTRTVAGGRKKGDLGLIALGEEDGDVTDSDGENDGKMLAIEGSDALDAKKGMLVSYKGSPEGKRSSRELKLIAGPAGDDEKHGTPRGSPRRITRGPSTKTLAIGSADAAAERRAKFARLGAIVRSKAKMIGDDDDVSDDSSVSST